MATRTRWRSSIRRPERWPRPPPERRRGSTPSWLYIFLCLAGLAALLVGFDTRRAGRWLAAGGLFGLAAWVRPQILTFLPILLAWIGWQARSPGRRRSAAVAAALLMASCAATVLPWTAYEYAERGRVIVVSSTGPFNLLVGTHPAAAFVDKDDHWRSDWGRLPSRVYTQAAALEACWQRIAARPGLFVRKTLWEAAHLWTLDSFVLRHLRNGWYGDDLPDALLPAAVVVTSMFSAFLIALGLLGLVAQPASPFRAVAGLTVLHAVLLFGVTYSLSRYAAPLRPLLAVGAGWMLAHPRALRTDLLDSWTRVGWLAAGIALLAFAWANDAPLLWNVLVDGGREFSFRWLD